MIGAFNNWPTEPRSSGFYWKLLQWFHQKWGAKCCECSAAPCARRGPANLNSCWNLW